MDVEAYLRRIQSDGPHSPSATTLRRLHRQHLCTVPFENLDIALGMLIRLDPDALFNKIVTRKRGGFCYELNGLFHGLLQALGFRTEMLSARVARSDGTFSPEFDHMLLRVDLEEPWIADVGFGDCFLDPLLLRHSDLGSNEAPEFALMQSSGTWDLVRLQSDGGHAPQYRFTEASRQFDDFADMCHFHQTSPESHFVQTRVCSKALPDGRVTVSGMRLIETRDGERRERELENHEELRECLQQRFAIEFAEDTDWSKLAG
jgi:N-hydroxyarylamine O-acetyltransferase